MSERISVYGGPVQRVDNLTSVTLSGGDGADFSAWWRIPACLSSNLHSAVHPTGARPQPGKLLLLCKAPEAIYRSRAIARRPHHGSSGRHTQTQSKVIPPRPDRRAWPIAMDTPSRIREIIAENGKVLRQPGAMKPFADLYAGMSEKDLVGSAIRIETERLEICGGMDAKNAHETIRLRLDSDAIGVVLAALCGDNESEEYLTAILEDVRLLIDAERFGRLS